jgi:hypothetical protein
MPSGFKVRVREIIESSEKERKEQGGKNKLGGKNELGSLQLYIALQIDSPPNT